MSAKKGWRRIVWKKPVRVYQQGPARELWTSFGVDPKSVAPIRKAMAKTRNPRTCVFETWKETNGQPVAHLRSGREILVWTDSRTRIRSIKRLYEILTTRTPKNTRYVELAAPYQPKKKAKV